MKIQGHRRAALLLSALMLALSLTAVFAVAAQAAPTRGQLAAIHVRELNHLDATGAGGTVVPITRGGPFVSRATLAVHGVPVVAGQPVGTGTAWLLGGIVALVVVGLTAFTIAASRGARRDRMASVSSIGPPQQQSAPAQEESSRRKAA